MVNPRDQIPQWNVPTNPATGLPLTAGQMKRLKEIGEAAETFYAAMHNAEGSAQPGEHQPHTWSTRLMALAGSHVEIAMLVAQKEALANP
jgi:hypothetical protein